MRAPVSYSGRATLGGFKVHGKDLNYGFELDIRSDYIDICIVSEPRRALNGKERIMPETMPVGEVCSEQIQTQRPRLLDVLRDRARRTGHPEATITSFAR